MPDALSALDELSDCVSQLSVIVDACRGKHVPPEKVRVTARQIASIYFEHVRAALAAADTQSLIDEVDNVLETILHLSSSSREKQAYRGQINEVRPFLQRATISLLKARGVPRLVLSETERAIIDTLTRMLPSSALSYEQALRDITAGQRVSWRGTGSELREVLRETVHHLAPDDQVYRLAPARHDSGSDLV